MTLLRFCALIVVVSLLSMKTADFTKNIKIRVPKMKESFKGLEWYKGELLMTVIN